MNKNYIRTANASKFFLDAPKASDWLEVEDIAYHLAGVYRFTGGSRISVAQHSVVAARMAHQFYPSQKQLPAKMLIHDVTESRYGDVSGPLKRLLPDYQALEHHAARTVEDAYNLLYLDDCLVKEVDFRTFLTERLVVTPMLTKEDDFNTELEPFPLEHEEFEENYLPWSSDVAEAEWLSSFRHLLPWVVWR